MTGNVPISKRKDLKFHCYVEAEVLFLEKNSIYAGLKNRNIFWDIPITCFTT